MDFVPLIMETIVEAVGERKNDDSCDQVVEVFFILLTPCRQEWRGGSGRRCER